MSYEVPLPCPRPRNIPIFASPRSHIFTIIYSHLVHPTCSDRINHSQLALSGSMSVVVSSHVSPSIILA